MNINQGSTSVKQKLSFYTNMPTPYQLDFFFALKDYFDLHVVYFTGIEVDRQWSLSTAGNGYKVTVLKNGFLAKLLQTKIASFHYSPAILDYIRTDLAPYVIVNGTYWSPNVRNAITLNAKKGKWVAYWSEPVFPVSNKLRFRLKQIMLKPVLNNTTCILAIGKLAENGYREYGYKKDIFQLPYNINVDLFSIDQLNEEQLENLRQKYKPQGEYIFLTSGSLITRKGIDTLIKAFNGIEGKNSKLLIIGDGPEREALVALANRNPNIIFLGFQEKECIPYWFNLANAFVFASRYDGWGLVINEALAAGKPVIASFTTGAVADKLDHTNSIILDPEDIAGFTNAMQLLAHDKALNEQYIASTREIAVELSSAYNAKKVYDICTNAK